MTMRLLIIWTIFPAWAMAGGQLWNVWTYADNLCSGDTFPASEEFSKNVGHCYNVGGNSFILSDLPDITQAGTIITYSGPECAGSQFKIDSNTNGLIFNTCFNLPFASFKLFNGND
jgi:hypothetical protein